MDRNRHRRTKYDREDSFYNKNEWQFWESIKHSPVNRYFFPVIDFNPDTHFLLMERAKKIPGAWGEFERHPSYTVFNEIMKALQVSDMGPRNAGVKSDGTLAALDYGFQRPAQPEHIEKAEKILEKLNG